jgi:hypothetical protein
MKKILFVAVIILLNWNFVICQNVESDNPLVEITSNIENGKLQYTFENQRNFESIQKLESFVIRIKNLFADDLEDILFLRENNRFKIEFKSKSPSNNTIENILMHFKVKNYEVK